MPKRVYFQVVCYRNSTLRFRSCTKGLPVSSRRPRAFIPTATTFGGEHDESTHLAQERLEGPKRDQRFDQRLRPPCALIMFRQCSETLPELYGAYNRLCIQIIHMHARQNNNVAGFAVLLVYPKRSKVFALRVLRPMAARAARHLGIGYLLNPWDRTTRVDIRISRCCCCLERYNRRFACSTSEDELVIYYNGGHARTDAHLARPNKQQPLQHISIMHPV
jgi:hypothetical protein